jgi:hypothetical protein
MSSAIPSIDIPVAGQLIGFPNVSMPSTDCSATINLQTQIAPLIASTVCQLKVLNLLRPLIEIIKSLPAAPAQPMIEFTKAAGALVPCLVLTSPASILPFVKELLCLEISSLRCFQANLTTLATLASINPGTVAASELQSMLNSYPPIVGILKLAGPLFEMAGLTVLSVPTLSGGIDPASLAIDQNAVGVFTAGLQTLADSLGGCP